MARKKSSNRGKSAAKPGGTRRRNTAKSPQVRGGTSGRRRSSGGRSSPGRSRRPARREPFRLNLEQKALITGIVLIFLTAIVALSLLSPNQGSLTSALASLMWSTFGWGGVVVPAFFGGLGFYLVLWGMEQPPRLPGFRLAGLLLLFLTLEAFATLVVLVGNGQLHDLTAIARSGTGGGYVGSGVTWLATRAVGTVGAIVVLAVLGLIGVALLGGVTRTDLKLAGRWLAGRWPAKRGQAWRRQAGDGQPSPARPPQSSAPPEAPTLVQPPLTLSQEPDQVPATAGATPGGRGRGRARDVAPVPPPSVAAEPVPIFLGAGSGPQQWLLPPLPEMLDAGTGQETNDAFISQQVALIEQTLASFGAPVSVVEINQGPTITQFGVKPQFIELRNGKRTKVKVGKIASLADDLALALAAKTIRIQAPVPGKGYVGIEVPNTAKSLVSLRDVMESAEFGRLKGPLRIGLGENVAGQPISANLANMPHLLIAGATGAGKSVCVNAIIACLLLQYTPEELRLVMVDPKRVELTSYNGIPHLVAPVVVDLERVASTLQWAMRQMDERYHLLAAAGARNVVEYNKKAARSGKEKLPFIVIIIDELADLMMMAPEETEKGITRLAQMARATGIHMVIATQRPSVDVVTGLIKANFPARIAFAVASSTDSRVILDTTGAERLLGQGDMLFQSPDAAAPVRLQGCFVGERELHRLIDYWQTARRQNLLSHPLPPITSPAAEMPAPQPLSPAEEADQAPAGSESQPALPAPASQATATPVEEEANGAVQARAEVPASGAPAMPVAAPQQPLWEDLIEQTPAEEPEDELMGEAIALVRKLNKASTSLLQRRFRIGYTRAARLIDAMEEQGVIGPPTGTSKARKVLPEE